VDAWIYVATNLKQESKFTPSTGTTLPMIATQCRKFKTETMEFDTQ